METVRLGLLDRKNMAQKMELSNRKSTNLITSFTERYPFLSFWLVVWGVFVGGCLSTQFYTGSTWLLDYKLI